MTTDPAHPAADASFGVARSFTGQRWRLRDGGAEAARALSLAAELPPALANILAARGVAADGLSDLLNPTLKRLLPEPLKLKDMDKAIARTVAALVANETIAVFGDYDVDGSSSSALLVDFFTQLDRPPRVYIPDRMSEGYGPNPAALRTLKAEGADLVITVDCGAAAMAALTEARSCSLDVVVLDHHAVETLPPAVAQVNPNQPGDTSGLGHLCAAGVVFLFLVALNRALRDAGWYAENNIAEPDLMRLLDLVGLATICDVVPLIGVNRAFVRAGLARLSSSPRPGLAALASLCKVSAPITPYHLGFVFGPRINAGGRVGRCSLGTELLSATNPETAMPLAEALDLHNKERQALESMIVDEALAMAGAQENMPFILLGETGWHPGVVGIVAGRLKDRFKKPALIVGFEGGEGRGSARSVPGIDIGAAIRAAREAGILGTGGGHAMAAGFSLSEDRLSAFTEFLAAHFANASGALNAALELDLDALVSPRGATAELVADIAQIGPFGAGNPEPLVVIPDVEVSFADVVGKDHVRLRLMGGDGARLEAIAFRAATGPLGQGLLGARGGRVHLAGKLRTDSWNGRTRVQLQVEDAAPAGV